MARQRRQDFPGAWHHVMNRGANHAAIFSDSVDRRVFLSEARSAFQHHGVSLHAYCLMNNHYHFLVHSGRGELSRACQVLAAHYTQYVNHRYFRDGPLFRGRFASVLVSDDPHLIQTVRYIHFNPVAAGLVAAPELWRWSSAAAYANLLPAPEWLDMSTIREMSDEFRDGVRPPTRDVSGKPHE